MNSFYRGIKGGTQLNTAQRHITNSNCCGRCPRPRVPENSSRASPFVLFSGTTFGAGDICYAKSYYLPQTSVTCNVRRHNKGNYFQRM